ncbi:hypothetical protein HZB94_04230 [Candidatus Falkowbacteria bacterium]|nr:hypothetical protein [Candidatus Falkowbacteria bacterium]
MKYKTPLERYRKKKERKIAKAYGLKMTGSEAPSIASKFSHSSHESKD